MLLNHLEGGSKRGSFTVIYISLKSDILSGALESPCAVTSDTRIIVTPVYLFEVAHAAGLLSLMANEKRLEILELIVEREWDVSSLATRVGLSQSALSQHLKKFRDFKLVKVRREAQTLHYSCTSTSAMIILDALRDIFCVPGELAQAA